MAAAHPEIAQRFSIGKSHEGRELWAMKISDNVATDEPEPEAMFDGGHHADEHMGVEMALQIMHWLVDGYGTDDRITRIVDNREVWIVFLVNPDGAEYDIRGGTYRYWRKNRQPTPGSSYVGTDLNRNYDYRWGGGGRTSGNPQAITYRGPSAFSAPETRAMRDFLRSRVVGGRQQIRTYVTFHEYGRLVMWPYGYTYSDVPADMTKADHDSLVVIGRQMGALNGYRPQQASELYISSGTSRDYAYGKYRIWAYTFELSNDDYLDDSRIASETGRNRSAILYVLDRASCPLAVLGTTVATARCGAFDDDLEVWAGWTTNPDGTDTATTSAARRVLAVGPGLDDGQRPEAAGDGAVGGAGLRHGCRGGLVGRRRGPGRPDVDPVAAHHPAVLDRAAAVLPLCVRPRRRRRPRADSLKAYIEEADGDLVPVWTVSRRRRGSRRGVDLGLREHGCLGRPDHPAALRRRRWRRRQPPRSRARRHPDHPPELRLATRFLPLVASCHEGQREPPGRRRPVPRFVRGGARARLAVGGPPTSRPPAPDGGTRHGL